jgi:hypothetical protein
VNLDVATSADVAQVLAELREMRAELAQVRAALPTTWISLRDAAQRMGVDPRTVAAMGERGEIVTRRAGRRWLVDAASLKTRDPAEISEMARKARTS